MRFKIKFVTEIGTSDVLKEAHLYRVVLEEPVFLAPQKVDLAGSTGGNAWTVSGSGEPISPGLVYVLTRAALPQIDRCGELVVSAVEEEARANSRRSVQPSWAASLSLQQQTVLFLGTRRPDGVDRDHPCMRVQQAYRASVFLSAKLGRPMKTGDAATSFMSAEAIAADSFWRVAVNSFFEKAGSLPHHYLTHLMHGAEVLGYKHPDPDLRQRWLYFYERLADDLHLRPETREQMDARLSDWGRQHWEVP